MNAACELLLPTTMGGHAVCFKERIAAGAGVHIKIKSELTVQINHS